MTALGSRARRLARSHRAAHRDHGAAAREGRYDRATDDVEQITCRPAVTIEQHVAANPDLFY
jgi:hypothetical protein